MRSFSIIPERIDLFERDEVRTFTGNTGYIDFFWSNVVLGEAKSLGRDLNAAFEKIRLDRLGDEPWTIKFEIEFNS